MIDLPESPLREVEVDESDPFIANALRPRKPHEPCWCGSGKKYKKCHRFREEEKALALGQIQRETNRIFWRSRGCMHPEAPSHCEGQVVDSHTIQRKGPLSKIVDGTNHVCRLVQSPSDAELVIEDLGWRKASIFPGFCGFHDATLFSDVETVKFDGSHRQCVLLAFRNVCNELYRKQALIETFEAQRQLVDRGHDVDRQISVQMGLVNSIEGAKKSAEELFGYWNLFQEALVSDDMEKFSSKVFFFEGSLSVVSSAALQVEFDCQGNKLADM